MSQATFEEAVRLHQQGRLAEAAALYQDVLRQQPNHFDALHLLGVAAVQGGNAKDAAAALEKAIGINAMRAETHFYHGLALNRLQRTDAAVISYDKAIALNPQYAEAHNSRANALSTLGRIPEAIAAYDAAVAIKPDYLDAYFNRGIVLRFIQQREAALASFEQLLALQPDHAESHYHRGAILVELSDLKGGLDAFETAISHKPDYAEAYVDRGNALGFLLRYDAALASYDQAIALKPDLAPAHSNRARILADMNRYPEAVAAYDTTLRLQPSMAFASGARLHAKLFICDWKNLDAEIADLAARVRRDEMATSPFSFLLVSDDAALHHKAAATATRNLAPPSDELGSFGAPVQKDKIRIGYFSADYHQHAMMALLAGVFEHHDRNRFDITAFSFDPYAADDMRRRIKTAFNTFIDVRDRSDGDIAALARSMNIDVAVDLSGYTRDNRMGIFARRAAPVQVNYLGYPGTMGAAYFDYLIADPTIVRPDDRLHYAEKIATLPHCYQPNDNTRKTDATSINRAALGLPETGFVFCCFNNNFKILPAVFDGWMRILQRTPGSVLWLLQHSEVSADNLRHEAAQRGINAKRLVFASRATAPEHLARHSAADLFLDTFPYTAHTTASDALWMGLPVLTRIGQSFPARVAASLLTAADLPELITTTPADYENLAVALASAPARLHQLKDKLLRNRPTSALFDTARYTRYLESAYIRMIERQRAGLAPDHVAIEA